MQVAWFKHLLADRGIHGDLIEARLVARGNELMLDVRTMKNDELGKRFVIMSSPGDVSAAEERHVIAIAGMIFEPSVAQTLQQQADGHLAHR